MVIPSKSRESPTEKENLWLVVPKTNSMVFVGVHDHAVFRVPLVRNLDPMKYPLFKGSRIHNRVIKLFVISVGVNINIFYMIE